jgi:hypothetical protein
MKIIITQQQFNLIVETKSTNIDCKMCDHSWDIEQKDKHPFLCHNCGYDNKSKKYNKKELDKFWDEYEGGELVIEDTFGEQRVKLNAGDYIDIQEEDKSTGNFLSAKIGMWKKHNKLSGTFSRRKVGNGIIRVFRVI